MGLMKNFFQQTRKPEGFLGKMMVGGMNGGGHAKLADWGMSHLEVAGVTAIAELAADPENLRIFPEYAGKKERDKHQDSSAV